MKLRKHREDVKDLRLMADGHIRDITKRYLNLILMAEEADRLYYRGIYTTKARRVMKDGEK